MSDGATSLIFEPACDLTMAEIRSYLKRLKKDMDRKSTSTNACPDAGCDECPFRNKTAHYHCLPDCFYYEDRKYDFRSFPMYGRFLASYNHLMKHYGIGLSGYIQEEMEL